MESLYSIPMFATFSFQLLILTFLAFETINVSSPFSVFLSFKLFLSIFIDISFPCNKKLSLNIFFFHESTQTVSFIIFSVKGYSITVVHDVNMAIIV